MKRVLAVVILVTLTGCSCAWAEGPWAGIYDTRRSIYSNYQWTFSSSVEFVTGRLDTSSTTRTLYVPLTLQRNLPRGRIAVTLPYISQRTSVDAADREGRIYQVDTAGATGFSNASGLSDILLKGAYDVFREVDGDHADLSAVGKIKFPSADETARLGTGEADESLGLEALRRFDQNQWFVMGDLYYTNVGDPPGRELNNEFSFSLGLGYQWPESVYLSLSYEERTALLDNRPNPRDFILQGGIPINDDTDITGNILWGLSEGAPDFGIGLGTNIRF